MKLARILSVLVLVTTFASAQTKINLTTQVQGILPVPNGGTGSATGFGYVPTAGSGLVLNLSAGIANCGSGTIVNYSAGTLTMTASTTNYVYLNTGSSCVPAVKTTAFVGADIPIATVVAGSSTITSATDVRTPFGVPSSSGTGTVTHTAGALTLTHCIVGNNAGDIKIDSVCTLDGSGNMFLNSLTLGGSSNGYENFGYTGVAAPSVPTSSFQNGVNSSFRPIFTSYGGSTFSYVGIATPGTSNNCTKFAANGIDLVDAGAPCGSGGGAVPIITIAPSNSPAPNASSATLVLSGTADQTAINTAIDTYCLASNVSGTVNGCALNFLPGIIHLTGSVVINRSGVTLQGQGWSSYGSVNAIGYGGVQIVADNSSGAFPLITVTTTTACYGPTGGSDPRCRGIQISNLYVVCHDGTQTGIFDTNTTDNEKIENNTVQNCGTAINSNGDSVDIGGNNVQYNHNGIASGNVHPNIHNNLVYDNLFGGAGFAIDCTAAWCVIADNTVGGGNPAIFAGGSSSVTGNTINNPIGTSIQFGTNAYGMSVVGNTIIQGAASSADWIFMSGCSGCTISGNSAVVTSGAQTGYFINVNPGGFNGLAYSVIANNAVSGPNADPASSFTNGIYNFGLPSQNVHNQYIGNTGSADIRYSDSSGATAGTIAEILSTDTPATSGSVVFASPLAEYLGSCWNGSASITCGYTIGTSTDSALISILHYKLVGAGVSGSVKFDVPAGVQVGTSSPVCINCDNGGNYRLGAASAVYQDLSGGFGLAFFAYGSPSADLWNINSLRFNCTNSSCAMLNRNGTTMESKLADNSAYAPFAASQYAAPVLYSAAGTPLPTCASGIKGTTATVSDATTPLYMTAYTSGGGITAAVICSYNGTTYSWLTH